MKWNKWENGWMNEWINDWVNKGVHEMEDMKWKNELDWMKEGMNESTEHEKNIWMQLSAEINYEMTWNLKWNEMRLMKLMNA